MSKSNKEMSPMRHILNFVKPYSGWVSASLAASTVSAICNLISIYLLKQIIDSAINKQSTEILKFLGMAVFMIAGGFAANYMVKYTSGRFSTYAMRDIRKSIAIHLEEITVGYVDKNHSGDIISRMSNDANTVQGFMENDLSNFVYLPLLFLCSFVYMMSMNWQLFLASFIIVPVLVPISAVIVNPIRKYSKENLEYLGKVNGTIQDTVSGIGILKAFNLEKVLYEKYKKGMAEALKMSIKIDRTNSLILPIFIVLHELPNLICILYGGYLCVKGKMSPGALVAYLQLLRFVLQPVINLPNIIANLKSSMGAADRLFEILGVEVERKDGFDFSERKDNEISIEFYNLSFAYDSSGNVLENLSFRLPKGKTIALVGSSGSGKSTIVSLLCRFYEPQTGEIKLYGQGINKWNLKSLRNQFSLVSQDTYLFPVTIAENIEFGKPGASREEIIEAAKAANAHDFIMELPEGYETMVGERGVKLSGGQRQRMSIARAILKNAPILLLDEPTSALDTQSEDQVQQALENFASERTQLVIAHRLSTIKGADSVMVLHKGSILETGTHDELMEKGGIYRELYMKQFISVEDTEGTNQEVGA